MRTPFAVGKLTRESAEIVILDGPRLPSEAAAGRALQALVRLARLDREMQGRAVH